MSIAEKKGYKKWTGNEFDYYQPEPIDKKKVKGTWAYNLDQIKQGLSNFGDKLYEGATNIDPLLQLGLLHSVYGDNSILQMYNQNIEAEKNREAQRAYNEYLKEYDRAKLAEEKAKRESVEQATAKAKIAQLLEGYGYKTPQQREIIDLQIEQAAKEAKLDTTNIDILKKQSVESAKQEALERSQKNAVLDPLKQEIRLHGPYSSDANWSKQSPDYIKATQRIVGTKADGVYGKKTAAAIDKWNETNPDKKITAPNELADILERIDNLRWGDNREFSPDELDELRKSVYGGDDPSTKNKQDWSDFYKNMAQQNAKEKAEQLKKDKARLAELQKAIDANYKLSATEEAEYKTLKAKGI